MSDGIRVLAIRAIPILTGNGSAENTPGRLLKPLESLITERVGY